MRKRPGPLGPAVLHNGGNCKNGGYRKNSGNRDELLDRAVIEIPPSCIEPS